MPHKSQTLSTPRASRGRNCRTILAVTAVALLAGCSWTKRHSITVGAVPDDYRTNHPIVISEKQQVLDLPVGLSSYGMSNGHRAAVDGFLADYDMSSRPFVTVLAPVGSVNEAAAQHASGEFAAFIASRGVPRDHVFVQSYQAPSAQEPAPIRIAFPVMKASTGPCGRWPEDIVQDTTANKHYANFGCAYQNNLAAQVANPTDFLGPRRQSEIDAENRDNAITDYKTRSVSEDFAAQSEVDY